MKCTKTNRVAMLATITLPSKYHATRRLPSGMVVSNPEYEAALTPRHAAAQLRREWARVRARLARGGAKAWGMRVVAPHHDGTPHMHALVYCCAEHEQIVRAAVRQIADGGCARILKVGHPHIYLEKYAKQFTTRDVAVWAWAWGIRISPVKFGDWGHAA
jgi:hypothetical protein